MRVSTLLILVCMIAGVAVLCSLGWWQVQRLQWKEALIKTVEQRVQLPPMEINEFLDRQMLEDNWPYSPVTATGIFDHSNEVYYFATSKSGGSGWNVHTPLLLENGNKLIVNRGFVPFTMKDPSTRADGQIEGEQTVTGLVRVMADEKPAAAFDNAPDKREFYWRSLSEMAEVMKTDETDQFVPFILEADGTLNPGGFPKGGTTIIKFSNNHLQYAGTWFGLALTLLGVGGYFLYQRGKSAGKS